ncbi:MAG: hypothetical protein CMJ25_03140 [Phycisphaerae bacterium]|nr:hypothetical protein [Phycisphaerae bacterium]|tara:strand:- start:16 stop:2025 length:2010 start_codon:yes stop_codon:yes gene_type:complete
MARSAPAISTFTAGEISPRLEGRATIEKYLEGLSILTNMIVQPHGGVARRPGTEYLGEVKDSSSVTRLIPFEFKTADTYALEFGNQYMRVFRNGLQVLVDSEKNVSAITKANPGVFTSNSHGLTNGDEVYLYNTGGGMTELVARNYLIANSTTNTFTLTDLFGSAIDTTGFTTYTGSGVSVDKLFEVATPYTSAQVGDVRFAQSADVMYLVHPSHAIRTLSRTDHNAWTFATPTINENNTPVLTSANNYPSVVTFFEQRLVFAATNNNPQTLWFSKSADYLNFHTGTADDDALIYTIASNKVNAIRYLSATRILNIGTSGGEYVLTTTNGGPITPTQTVIRKYSNYGCIDSEVVQVADVTLFAQRGARKVREFRYIGEVDVAGYSAPDITILSEHLTEGGIQEFAYQQEPESIIWARRTDGTLLGLTYRREEEIVAWHKHIIGGAFSGGQAKVESIITLPTDSGEDELYMIVKRTINGVTKQYVEVMKTFDFGSDTTAAFFVDSGLVYSGSATTTLSGLYHLEGEELSILANGATHAEKTVSNGGVALDFSVTTGAVGFGYTSEMQTMRLESGSQDGTSQGKPKRIHDITVRFYETVGAEVGSDSASADRIFFRDSSMNMDEAVPLFTGDKEIEFEGGFVDGDRIYVRQSQPLPMTVLALYPRMNTFDL